MDNIQTASYRNFEGLIIAALPRKGCERKETHDDGTTYGNEASVVLSQTVEYIQLVSDQNQPHQDQQNTGDNIDIF